MRDVSAWLRGLGLGQYASAFEHNQIDADSLPYLTDSMLERIGLPVGPRVKLLAAISELAPRLAAGPQTGLDERTQGGAIERRQAERRQITVMFCDLVDSTRLAGSLDPEDFGRVMQSFQRACGTIIERHEGHISQYRGDAIEAYFGWPAAYEDAPSARARGARGDRGNESDHRSGTAAGARRHQHRHGDGQRKRPRRSVEAFWRGRRGIARGGAPASARRAQFGRHRRGHEPADLDAVRAGRSGAEGPEGRGSARARISRPACAGGHEPLSGRPCRRLDPARRAAHRARLSTGALARRQRRGRADHLHFRHGRDREVAHHPRARAAESKASRISP